jgi:hypothetical protein
LYAKYAATTSRSCRHLSGSLEGLLRPVTTNVHLRVQHTGADGFDSGWHVHPGLAVGQVEEGSLQIYENGCTPKTVAAGDTSIEIPYRPVRAIATGHVAWTTTFVVDGAGLFLIPLSTYSPGTNPCPSLP